MKVLLIFPPRSFSSKEPLPSLGLIYLAAFLEQAGLPVEVVDASVEKYNWRQIENLLRRRQPDVVGIPCLTELRFEAFQLAETAKKVLPQSLVVLGGPHVFSTAEDILANIPAVDIVLRGEGEESFRDLALAVQQGRSWDSVPSLTFRRDGRIITNPLRPLENNLDTYPFPARHLLPWQKYNFRLEVPGVGRLPAAHLITSRGCPFGCSFCVTSLIEGRRWRARSAANVVAEVEEIVKNQRAKVIWFYDDTFTMDKKRVEEICRLILEKRLEIHFTCSIRVDTVNRELLALMKQTGCFKIFYGVESGCPRVLAEATNKKIGLDQVRRVSQWLDELGIQKNPSYIVGFPGETYEEALQTIDLMKEIGGLASFSYLRIYPGTEIEAIAKQKGLLPPDFSWSRKMTGKAVETLPAAHGQTPLFLDRLTWNDIGRLTARWAAYQKTNIFQKAARSLSAVRSFKDLRKLAVLGGQYLKENLAVRRANNKK